MLLKRMKNVTINRKGSLEVDQKKGVSLCQSGGGNHSQMNCILSVYERAETD